MRRKNNSGIILLVVLWILVILSSLAIGLSRRTHVDLALTKHSVGEVKSKYLAWAGLMQAFDQIHLDSSDDESSGIDNLYYCAMPASSAVSAEELYSDKQVGEGYFQVAYQYPVLIKDQEEWQTYFGIQDEERKININALDVSNVDVLIFLFQSLGVSEDSSKTMAYSILDWKDTNDLLSHEDYGAESDYYEALTKPYKPKNRPFDTLQELLMVRGVTEDIFYMVQNDITVFPKDKNFAVNFDTAPARVLKAVALAKSGPETNTDSSDVDSLVEKILEYRAGEDGQEFTADDQMFDETQAALNQKELALFLSLRAWRIKKSEYLNVHVKGVEENFGAQTNINAIVRREDLAILYWRRN